MLSRLASRIIANKHGAVMHPPIDLHENLERLKALSKQMPQYPQQRRIDDTVAYNEFVLDKGGGKTKEIFHEAGVTSAAHTVLEGGTDFPVHKHAEMEVIVLIKGTLIIEREGQVFVLAPGGTAILPPNSKHSAITPTGCEFLAITIPDSPDFPRKVIKSVTDG